MEYLLSVVSWDLECNWHKIEGLLTIGQLFGSASGNLNMHQEKLRLQTGFEYGTDQSEAHTLSFSIDSTQLVEENENNVKCYLTVEVRCKK